MATGEHREGADPVAESPGEPSTPSPTPRRAAGPLEIARHPLLWGVAAAAFCGASVLGFVAEVSLSWVAALAACAFACALALAWALGRAGADDTIAGLLLGLQPERHGDPVAQVQVIVGGRG